MTKLLVLGGSIFLLLVMAGCAGESEPETRTITVSMRDFKGAGSINIGTPCEAPSLDFTDKQASITNGSGELLGLETIGRGTQIEHDGGELGGIVRCLTRFSFPSVADADFYVLELPNGATSRTSRQQLQAQNWLWEVVVR